MNRNENSKRILFGMLIVLLGVLILMKNFGYYNEFLSEYIFRWEMILVGIGLISVISHGGRGPGFFMILLGGAFILRDYVDLPQVNFWQLFLAVLFILAGVFMIIRRKNIYRCSTDHKTTDLDAIDEVAVFGGGDRTIVTDNFKGGRILAVFGGSNFNLMRSKLAPGKNYLDLMIIFGGMKMIIPEDWNIKIEATPIFGGFTDKHRVSTPLSQTEDKPVLIIKGLVIFGGGEIISY